MEISKELFEEVTGSFNKEIFALILKGNSIEINLFFFKCKEWLNSTGFDVVTSCNNDGKVWTQLHKYDKRLIYSTGYFHSTNEVCSIIKACEWVLKEINEKQLRH